MKFTRRAYIVLACILTLISVSVFTVWRSKPDAPASRTIQSAADLLLYAAQHKDNPEMVLLACSNAEASGTIHDAYLIHKLKANAYAQAWRSKQDPQLAELAEQHYQLSIAAQPENLGARAALAMLYYDESRIEEAQSIVGDIRRYDASSPYLALLDNYHHEYPWKQEPEPADAGDEALSPLRIRYAVLRRDISNQPTLEAYMELGDLLLDIGSREGADHTAEAITAWKAALDLDRANVEILSRLIQAALKQQDYSMLDKWTLEGEILDPEPVIAILIQNVKIKKQVVIIIQDRINATDSQRVATALEEEILRINSEIEVINKLLAKVGK